VMNELIRWIAQPLFMLFLCSNALALDGTLVIANRGGGSISLYDLATSLEVARLPIGPRIPHEVAVSPDGRWAVTAEYGPDSNRGRHLVVIDIPSARIVDRIDLGPNSRPHSVVFLPDSRRVVATMQDADELALVDITNSTVLRTYPTGGREGHMVRLNPDATRAYVSSRESVGTLSVIFLEEDRAPVVIHTGAGAEGLDVTPDGSEIWVANRREATISIVDTSSLEVIARIDSRPFAGRVAIGPEGRVVVPNGTGGQLVPQYARVFDGTSREMINEAPLRNGEPDQGNFGVLIHDGLVFVTDPGQGNVQMFELETMAPRGVFITGHENPDGMAWSPLRVTAMRE